MYLLVFLALVTVAVTLSQIISFARMYRYVENELKEPLSDYIPPLAVILPCKGLDPGFRENIEKLLEQDYSVGGKINFEIIFSVASDTDPAYPVLKEILENQTRIPYKLIVAGINSQRAQKINNQLEALKVVSDRAEVLAFVDSDVIARNDFLRHLIGRLQTTDVGATTGYRFYIPSSNYQLASLIRSIWNRVSAWEMASPSYCFAWGGAMAIKRSVFAQAKVAEHWDCAADDDLSLTTAVKALGLKVHFVPQCLVASFGDAPTTEIVEWTNRQLILTKVYYPKLWRRAILRAGIMALWLIAVITCAVALITSQENIYLQGLLAGLSILPIELYFLNKGQALWQKVLTDRREEIDKTFWGFCLAIPFAHLVLPWMTLYSLCTNRIQWRGVTYELRSPSETIVV
ncbi:MAG: glycosyltransferase family 2 protein [Candidatus Obscuribacterales bacterium]|nr:glycosyltransferase family 2 protein [Candidatus Obscuribacterales bacterium]